MEYRTMRKTFRQLLVWRESHALTLLVYKTTRCFPPDEKFGIISQLRRASSSIGAQIAEGSQMPTIAHRLLYYQRAYASASEVDNFLELSRDLGYLQTTEYLSLLKQLNMTNYLLSRLINAQKSNPRSKPISPIYPTAPIKPISHNHVPEAAH